MKPNSVFSRSFTLKRNIFKVLSSSKRRKNSCRLYGTSSKPADSNLNSKLNWFSLIKNTSETLLPAFWKSLQVSSSVINNVLFSVKKSANGINKSVNEPVTETDDFQKLKIEGSDLTVNEKKPVSSVPSVPVKETEDSSYLEQAFFDWLSTGSAKRQNELKEKHEKEAPISKKVSISKSSLQQRSRFLVHSLNEAVSSGSQLLRLEEVCKHLLLYPHQKTEMCKVGLRRAALRLKYHSRDTGVQDQAHIVLALIGWHDPPRGQGIRILSIDGGGTRGIMAIEVLRQLEAKTNKKVHELFDYVCGVSSGAILGLLLCGLRVTLDECENLYRKLSDEVFRQSAIWGTGRLMWSHAYYDTTMWVEILKKTFGEKIVLDTLRCRDSPKIGIVSAIMNLPHLQPFVFRSYDFAPQVQSHYLGSSRYRMWEAIRASGAAPGYFEEYCLDDYLHQDGGIIVNNPAALAIHEARLIWPSEPIQCVLSLGSGRYLPITKPVITSTSLKTKVLKVIDSATDTEATHVVLNDLLSPFTYFRINPYLTEFFSLDENQAEKLDQMKSDAQMYLRRNEFKFTNCATALCIERSYRKRIQDWLVTKKNLYL